MAVAFPATATPTLSTRTMSLPVINTDMARLTKWTYGALQRSFEAGVGVALCTAFLIRMPRPPRCRTRW
jgi:hypothetical protein